MQGYHQHQKQFAALSKEEQLIIEVIAINDGKISFNDLVAILSQLAPFKSNPDELQPILFQPVLTSLVTRGFLRDNRGYFCPDNYFVVACRSAIDKKIGHKIFGLIKIHHSKSQGWYGYSFINYTPRSALKNAFFDSHPLYDLCSDKIDHANFNYCTQDFKVFKAFTQPFDPEWFAKLEENRQIYCLVDAMRFSRVFFISFDNIFNYFKEDHWLKSSEFLKMGAAAMAEHYFFRGEFDKAIYYARHSLQPEAKGIIASIALLEGLEKQANSEFASALKEIRKFRGRSKAFFNNIADFFFLASLCRQDDPASLKAANSLVNNALRNRNFHHRFYTLLDQFLTKRHPELQTAHDADIIRNHNHPPLLRWISLLAQRWLPDQQQTIALLLPDLENKSEKSGFLLIYNDLLALRAAISNEQLSARERKSISKMEDIAPIKIHMLLEPVQEWKSVIESLKSIFDLASATESERKIIWRVFANENPYTDSEVDLTVTGYELKRLKSGRWSAGKALGIDKFKGQYPAFPEYFSEQDQRIISALNLKEFTSPTEPVKRALLAMCEHPHVYSGLADEKMLIEKAEPVLILDSSSGSLKLSFHPDFGQEKILAVLESEYCIKVYEASELHIKAATLLSKQCLFPLEARDEVLAMVSSLSDKIAVRSTVEGSEHFSSVETVPCNKELYVLLIPEGEGLRIKVRVRPFGSAGPSYFPGTGPEEVYCEKESKQLHSTRDFVAEHRKMVKLEREVPMLEGLTDEYFDNLFSGADEALQLLLQLNEAKEATIEWPSDKRIKKVSSLSSSSMSLRIRSHQDWFNLDGEIKIDEDRVLSLKQLLELHAQSSGKFVKIGENEFIALTQEFRKRIEDIHSFSEFDADQLRVHQLAAGALEESFSDLDQVTYDNKWRKALQKVKDVDSMKFVLPSTLTVELRDYQLEAFQWLCRMSYLGMGACLADDMGLGKTVEALAVIVHNATRGPTLVVAPTSVCMNWYQETRRFAPTLNPIIFSTADRQKVIDDLQPYDLVICTYGIMQNEIDKISTVQWETIVLDEAQAIKNMATSRSKAAMLLRGNFRLIMTGTPIENHLGELWNLFRFINPGMLGSIESFNERFANLIQNQRNKPAQLRLKRLLQPFVLRRTKSQVLQDLPPRTEITLRVDLSEEEMALYENMRRNALDKITNSKARGGQNHIKILAELMRLRRLCCNPSLVAPELNLKSSKLELLTSLVVELLENKHKALVFSQFVDHLTIVRKMLESQGINYQYLDGSTPTKARTKAIDAFQAGDGDIFLISLKAGGLGLNLTAADYVIHLDPWWNPAVEDQASDRAHRMGQTRPVTIYRLITSNTIEEKIVDLHHRKRDLADGLLEGSDIAGKISTTELFDLLKTSL